MMKDNSKGRVDGVYSKLQEMFGMDIRSLALFRAGLAIATIGDLCERSIDLRDHYADEGIFPRALLFEQFMSPYTILIHGMNGTTLFLAFIFILHAICAFFLLVGYRTRTFTFLCWLFLVSLQSRNPFLNHGGDLYFRLLFFYAMFLPLGGCWSVDSALKDSNTKQKPNRSPRVLTGGTVALLSQIAMMYLVSTEHKTGEEWRSEFSAVWYALQLDYYKTTVALILQLFPKLLEFLTWAVFQWEFFGPFCLCFPVFTDHFRLFGVVGFFFMHFGFIVCIRLGFFFWVCTIALFPLLPPTVWDFFLKRFRRNPRNRQPTDLQIQFDANSKFSKNLAYILASFLAIPPAQLTAFQTSLLDGEEPRNQKTNMIWLYAENNSGKITTNFQAIGMALEHSPTAVFFSPFLYVGRFFGRILPGLVVRLVANLSNKTAGKYHSESLANRTIAKDPPRHQNYYREGGSPIKIGHIFVMGVIFYCLSWNMGNLGSTLHFPEKYNWIGMVLHVDQFWGMFSPHPPKAHWYYVIQAEMEDGREMELFKNQGLFRWEGNTPFNFDKPDPFNESFKNHRWYKFFEMGFNGDGHESIRLNFGRWVCREWNARHTGNDRLYRYKIHFLLEWQNLYGDRNPPSKQVLWDHVCYFKDTKAQ